MHMLFLTYSILLTVYTYQVSRVVYVCGEIVRYMKYISHMVSAVYVSHGVIHELCMCHILSYMSCVCVTSCHT